MLIIKLVSYIQTTLTEYHLFANDNWPDEFLLIIVADLVFAGTSAEYIFFSASCAILHLIYELAGN